MTRQQPFLLSRGLIKHWLVRHWQTIAITLIAGVILWLEFQAAPVNERLMPRSFTNPFFVATGKWGIRFLLISLAITPIYSLTGWRFPIKLRKPVGLLAFAFVTIHAGIHLAYRWNNPAEGTFLMALTSPDFVIFGVTAFTMLTAMAITSFKLMMKRLGRYWKPLHRLVYLAAILIMVHSMLATMSGKRSLSGGEESFAELQIYLGILILLLLARVPFIRDGLRRVLPFGPGPRRSRYRQSEA